MFEIGDIVVYVVRTFADTRDFRFVKEVIEISENKYTYRILKENRISCYNRTDHHRKLTPMEIILYV